MKKNIKIPAIKLPTEDEMTKISFNWWNNLLGLTFLDYSTELNKYTFPYTLIKIEKSDLNKIINLFDGKSDEQEVHKIFENLLPKSMFSKNGNFVKFITRSPKDYLADFDNYGKPSPVFNSKQVMDSMLSSMRFMDDLFMISRLDVAHFVIRPYIKFHPQNEFRIFVKDGIITAISQYYYMYDFKFTKQQLKLIEQYLRNFINDNITPNMKVSTYVADVVCINEECDTTLIETNPYYLSDPCLFTHDTMDGSFKVFKP